MEPVVYEVPVTRARAEFADLVNRVVYGGERVVLTRHGKPIVALVPAEDLDRLDREAAPEAQIIRLSTDHRPGAAGPVPGHRLDAAAEHRPLSGEPRPPGP